MTYSDGSEYSGEFDHGIFQGQGVYHWGNEQTELIFRGHSYEGNWTKGKMNGTGKFYHREGHVLSPNFKNNLYFVNATTSMEPFKTYAET